MLPYLCLTASWHKVRCAACVVSWLDACTAPWMGGLVQCCSPALVGWLLFCVCVPSVVSCSSFLLPVHA